VIHAPFDADRNWISRKESEDARRAMQADRRARNVQTAVLWANALALVAMGVIFVGGLLAAIRAGLFAWMGF
jgi:hypothetical protein